MMPPAGKPYKGYWFSVLKYDDNGNEYASDPDGEGIFTTNRYKWAIYAYPADEEGPVFLIDQDGTIYRLMPENYMARHVIGLNHCAIGIENVGGTNEVPLTLAQLEANISLIRYLKIKYEIKYLIGHQEYILFEDHELWLEKDDSYRTKKSDPGIQFMKDIREAVADLQFLVLPE